VRILIVHNRYQQRGGEDAVVANEAAMLQRYGHQVDLLEFDNDAIHGVAASLLAGGRAFYSQASARIVAARIDRFRPQLLHLHNFLGTLSPSVFFAAQSRHIPLVLTLHNYRLLCASAVLFREGHPCEECIEKRSFLPGVQHACYRGSRMGSAAVGGSIAFHAVLGTWTRRVARYITLTRFAAEKMAGFRVPRDLIRIKPNFVPDLESSPNPSLTPDPTPDPIPAPFALFAGRLSVEKGISTLIEADAGGQLPLPVHVLGDGPMSAALAQAARRPGSRLVPLGSRPPSEVREVMRKAAVLLLPSLWYEGFPMVCAEAFAAGLPVLASNIGGLGEIVEDGVSGHLFPPGDASALVRALHRFASPSPELAAMRLAARRRFESHYTMERNYQTLMAIYRELVPGEPGGSTPPSASHSR
jgi:glycosyltransferase involved in cell wall biosynthesis